jgi:hypothetical protein
MGIYLNVWCLPTWIMFALLYDFSLSGWCSLFCMMSTYLYDFFLPVWCLLYCRCLSTCLMSPRLEMYVYLFNVFVPVWCQFSCAAETSKIWLNNSPFHISHFYVLFYVPYYFFLFRENVETKNTYFLVCEMLNFCLLFRFTKWYETNFCTVHLASFWYSAK